MTNEIRTPVFVFGSKYGDLHIAASMDHAIEHAEAHSDPCSGFDDYEFFDFDGQPIEPAQGQHGQFTYLDQHQSLHKRVRGLISRCLADFNAENSDVPEELLALLMHFRDGSASFEKLAARLAELPAKPCEKHNTEDPAHLLCHRLHICS